MPRQNRVDPFGALHAVPDRGLLMGNRGCLHDDAGRIVRRNRGTSWISCLPAWPGVRRTLMAPGSYTELFFLDEATALAAGHVPCSQCRREAAREFRTLFAKVTGVKDTRAEDVHKYLHAERTGPPELWNGAGLPDGAIVGRADGTGAWMLRSQRWWQWRFSGYAASSRPPSDSVMLTPPTIRMILAYGYQPLVHDSAVGARRFTLCCAAKSIHSPGPATGGAHDAHEGRLMRATTRQDRRTGHGR